MVGIKSWQQQVPIPQPYTGSNHWSIPLSPVYETNPLSTKSNFMKGAVALAVNGIPIFNAFETTLVGNGLSRPLAKFRGHFEAKDMSRTCPRHVLKMSQDIYAKKVRGPKII